MKDLNSLMIAQDVVIHEDFHFPNHILKKVTFNYTVTGMSIGLDPRSGLLRVSSLFDLNNLEDDGEYGKKTILLARIKLLELFPGALPNILAYPVDFCRRHYRVKFRDVCIQEFERVLEYVWDIPENPDKMEEIVSDFSFSFIKDGVTSTNQKPVQLVSDFFNSLFGLYLGSKQYEKIPPILEWARKYGIIHTFDSLHEYFYKVDQVEKGILWIQESFDSCKQAGLYSDVLERELRFLQAKRNEKYHPRKIKNYHYCESEIIRFNGKFAFER